MSTETGVDECLSLLHPSSLQTSFSYCERHPFSSIPMKFDQARAHVNETAIWFHWTWLKQARLSLYMTNTVCVREMYGSVFWNKIKFPLFLPGIYSSSDNTGFYWLLLYYKSEIEVHEKKHVFCTTVSLFRTSVNKVCPWKQLPQSAASWKRG